MSDEFLILRPQHRGGNTVAKSSGEVPVMGPGESDRILQAVTGERGNGARCGYPTAADGSPCGRMPAPGSSRCHMHQSKKGSKVKAMSTKQALKALRKAARVAPAGSPERARCEQLRTFHTLRGTYAPLEKAIPPDQAQAIDMAVRDAESRATRGAVSTGSAERQIRSFIAGTGPRASLAGTADAEAVARMQTNPVSGMGFTKTVHQMDPGAWTSLVKGAEAEFARARAEGSADDIARAGEALTLARLRVLHKAEGI